MTANVRATETGNAFCPPYGGLIWWKLLSLDVREFTGKIEGAFKAAIDARASALLVHPVALFDRNAGRIAELAAKSRLPAMYGLRLYVEAGGLMFRQAAVFVDKILRGAKPTDLPVEQPTKLELLVNLKAAKAIGLTIPQSLRSRAEEVLR